MFRQFTLAIFRLRNEKLSKQLYSRPRMCYVGWVVWVQGVLLLCAMSPLI